MPDPALQAYLASKYLSGPKADAILARSGDQEKKLKKKKKKRRTDGGEGSISSGLRFKDDDDKWGNAGEDDDDGAVVVEEAAPSRFRPASWNTVREGSRDSGPPEEDEPIAAEDMPQVVDGNGASSSALTGAAAVATAEGIASGSGTPKLKAGLRTREEMRAERLVRQAAEEAAAREAAQGGTSASSPGGGLQGSAEDGQGQETIYRDASGRKIDAAADAAERRAAKREEERREREKKEWGKGLVQRQEMVRKKQMVEAEKDTAFARHSDDAQMNATLRSQSRWADPAAAFLTKPKSRGPAKPKYSGPAPPPNRFGIMPGYRWDGVDRSNGFEKMMFQKQNERKRSEAAAREWGQEDM